MQCWIRRTVEASYVRSGAGSDSGSGAARRTLPAEISRRATTIARLSDAKRGFAPLRSCFALFAASITSSKRLGISDRQSSTVILAMAVCYLAASRLTRDQRKRSVTMREREFCLLHDCSAPGESRVTNLYQQSQQLTTIHRRDGLGRTTSTEQFARTATSEETLPIRKRSIPLSPRAPITMQSACQSTAASRSR